MDPPVPLRRNRDFQLLWAGQALSMLGSRVSAVALPLLVLAVTESPAKLGLTVFAESGALMAMMLVAGALADRYDRRRIMLAADAARLAGMTSLAAVVAFNEVTFAHILVVAVVEGVGYAFFSVAERSALRNVVASAQLPAALAQNQAREYAALLGGPPLGGLLFALGRTVAFVFDAFSYAVSFVTILLLRTRLQEERQRERARLSREIHEGVTWLWQQPFLRATSLLVTGSDLVVNALFVAVIVIARERGASPEVVGLVIALLGAGGLLGSAIATAVTRTLSTRAVVIATLALEAALVPLIAFVPHPLLVGGVFGAMFLLHPSWNAAVGAYRIRLTPDHLQGRVQSVSSLFSLGAVPLGALAVGFAIEAFGSKETVLGLAVVMAAIALAAVASPSVRAVPDLPN